MARPHQVKKTLEALRQRQEEEAAHSEISQKAAEQGRSGTSQEKWETEQREITTELLKLKDRLIDVEKSVCHHFCLIGCLDFKVSHCLFLTKFDDVSARLFPRMHPYRLRSTYWKSTWSSWTPRTHSWTLRPWLCKNRPQHCRSRTLHFTKIPPNYRY